MNNQYPATEQVSHIVGWQVAYAARELRHNKTVTLSCLQSEAPLLLEKLSSFSNSSPVMRKAINKPNSKEVYLEIVDAA